MRKSYLTENMISFIRSWVNSLVITSRSEVCWECEHKIDHPLTSLRGGLPKDWVHWCDGCCLSDRTKRSATKHCAELSRIVVKRKR